MFNFISTLLFPGSPDKEDVKTESDKRDNTQDIVSSDNKLSSSLDLHPSATIHDNDNVVYHATINTESPNPSNTSLRIDNKTSSYNHHQSINHLSHSVNIPPTMDIGC